MQVGQFPAAAASSLIQGYCDDFVSLAAILAQTLEQVSMRGLGFEQSRPALQRIERGMRELAEAIHELLERGQVTTGFETVLGRPKEQGQSQSPAPASAPAAPPRGRDTTPRPPQPAAAAVPPAAPARPAPARPAPSRAPEPARAPAPASSVPPPRPAAAARPSPAPAAAAPAARATTAAAPPNRPAPGVPRSAKPEPFQGTSQSMPVLSVFQFLGRMRKSGTMTVELSDETMSFEFANGCVQYASSDRTPPTERLGELLVELGFCTREALAPLLAQADATNETLGDLVLQQKLVSHGQVLEALEMQVHRRFARACEATNAAYRFEDGQHAPTDGRIRITPMELAFEQKKSV